jgi:predicted DNA-binding transcriptional regulator AlpA
MTDHEGEALLTESELADRLHLSLGTVKRMRYSGAGPPFLRLGGRIRYDPAAVREWLREQGRERRG